MARKIAGLLVALTCAFWAAAAAAETDCNGGPLPTQGLMKPDGAPQPNLVITGSCNVVPGGEYLYGNVNILDGGVLNFSETIASRTNFWASSVIIENGGIMKAGTPQKPFGIDGGILTIHLYGKAGPSAIDSNGNKVPVTDQGKGVPCQSLVPNGTKVPCGIPVKVWNSNGTSEINGCGPDEKSSAAECLPGLLADDKDRFYQYGTLYGDGGRTTVGCPAQLDGTPNTDCEGYFGYKTLAVSFGGSLALYGYKGASYDTATDDDHLSSGVSWIRLADNLSKTATSLKLEKSPGDKWWNAADTDVQIVVTTTDYLPGHSEELKVTKINGDEVTFDSPIQWKHVGKRFPLATRLAAAAGRMTLDPNLVKDGAETRAAVALLTRSIQIVSAGDDATKSFADMPATYSFGAQMIARQGFKKVQIQGVEFRQMGEGGRLGHYPVHFHMTRTTPPDTFVKDSSVNESMNRWYVIHATHDVTLARNVGWKSIGHGYYLENGDETDNNFYSNIGIFARGAVDNVQNPRKVPGILSYNKRDIAGFPFRSDNEYPSIFWITNGWNDFIGNMAAGAGTCGACYWLVPAENATKPDVPQSGNNEGGSNDLDGYMKWSGYAALQKHQFSTEAKRSVPSSFAGATPLKSFYGNSCTSAMHSFQTTQDAPVCHGVNSADFPKAPNTLVAVESIAPAPLATPGFPAPTLEADDPYYPHYIGARHATRCPPAATQVKGQPPAYDCTGVVPCDNPGPLGTNEDQCAVTVLDHYTSAFNWAENGVAAIWLRPQWYLVDNSVLSDVQNAALTFVTSGTYDRAAAIEGDWALARNTVFIGNTQTGNPYASNAGPFNQGGTLKSDLACDGGATPELYCLNAAQGVSMPLTAFSVAQRFFSIYDGPAYEDSNIFLDIGKTDCNGTDCMYAGTAGVRKDALAKCYLPNAAIAWKQPNGFFYPPTFHSTNLFFDSVAIRHYVIDALFQPNTYLNDKTAIDADYCTPNGKVTSFVNYTDIDRQTELNDDDGSLTGLTNDVSPPTGTISVNPVEFFDAPLKTAECLSNLGVTADKACPVSNKLPATDAPTTATTSPYDYVTTAIIPECGVDAPGGKPNPGRCGDDTKFEGNNGRDTLTPGRSGTWSQECTNPACYGVPLYRQLLTGNDGTNGEPATREWATWIANKCNDPKNPNTKACRFPFVRMGGQATYQRSTLTANHGTYYLDTTVPRPIQWQTEKFSTITPCEFVPSGPCQPRSVNVFEEKQKYYVYFLYAKRATRQTYQIYVGPGFNVDNDVEAGHADLNTSPVVKFDTVAWPTTWTRNYNDAVACPKTNLTCGILQVTVDFGASDFSDLDLKAANGLCLPHTFCSDADDAEKAPDKDCGCALKDDDPLVLAGGKLFKQECVKVCGSWAVKDLDFPKDGPWGFSFKMPKGFTPDATLANPSPHRPLPAMFPAMASTGKPDWLTKLEKTKTEPDQSKGECFYPALKVPGETDCPVIQ